MSNYNKFFLVLKILLIGFFSLEIKSNVVSNIGPITKNYIKLFLPQMPVIVEAGAYDGTDTVEMSKLWPRSIIFAFEPVPKLFEILKSKTKDINNIVCYNMALADRSDNLSLYLSEVGEASSSLLPPALHLDIFSFVQFNTVIQVPATTLDQWAKKNNISKIDFLWLDMQGYEPVMLKASPNILKTVKVIYTEVNTVELYKGCILYPEFKKWLNLQGFKLIREEINPNFGGDALFVRI